jgi:hypothetical protein
MNHADFTTRLHECLDARHEPLDDEALCAYLQNHPEHLAGFAALRASIGLLAAAPVPARRSAWWPLGLLATAAASGAFVLCADDPPAVHAASGILSTSLEETPARAHAAVTFEVRQTLLATASTHVLVYERRSEPR